MKLTQIFGGLLCALGGWALTACSADGDSLEVPEGKGYVKLDLNAETEFRTKASESEYEYKNVNNYTVQILQNGVLQGNHEYLYSEMPNFIELGNGSYSLKAFYGEDKAVYEGADTLKLRFSDEEAFTLSGDTASVKLNCEPNSARINVAFAESMDTYFSDYQVVISTAAQGGSVYLWKKDTKGPVYFKVNNQEKVGIKVELTPKTGSKAEPYETTYTLSPKDAKKITVAASSSSGSLGITIKIDETVVEHVVNINIPSDWVE